MNTEAILALIGDLYVQLSAARQTEQALRTRVVELEAAAAPAESEGTLAQ